MSDDEIKILIITLPTISLLIAIVYMVRKEIEKSRLFLNASEKLILRKEMEEEINKKNKNIINDQHERLHEMKRQAEFGKLSKGLFHDLMNPLTTIILHTKNLNYKDKDDIKKFEYNINNAIQAGERMTLYMENIRNSLKNEDTNKMCSFIEEMEKVILLLSYRIKEHNITLSKKLSCDYIWFGNSILIQHVFTNLISNAIDSLEIKSGGDKKQIKIEFTKHDNNFYAKIIDNGIGIEKEKINKIFEPFYTTKDKDKGVGIGLTMVKSIIEEKMLGTISVYNNIKYGVCFTIKLPL